MSSVIEENAKSGGFREKGLVNSTMGRWRECYQRVVSELNIDG